MPIRPENRGRYPADWKLRSYFVRLIRARGRCEWCQAAHGQPHPVTGSKVILTTAHVFDHRPEACSLLNLAALCQLCHNRHDAAHRRAGRKARLDAASGQGELFESSPSSCQRKHHRPRQPKPAPNSHAPNVPGTLILPTQAGKSPA